MSGMADGTCGTSTSGDRDPVGGVIRRLDGPVAPAAAFAVGLRARLLADLGAADAVAPSEEATMDGATTIRASGVETIGARRPVDPARRNGPRPRLRPVLDALAAAVLIGVLLASALAGWRLRPDGGGGPATVPAIAEATPGGAVDNGAAMFLGNAARTGESAGPGPVGEPTRRWRVAIAPGERNVHPVAPTTLDGVVYVPTTVFPIDDAAARGFVIARDAATGEERWRTEVVRGNSAAVSPAAVVGDLLVVGTTGGVTDSSANLPEGELRRFGDLVALDARTGGERWRVPTGGSASSSPAIADDGVFVATADGSVLALDATDGRTRWRATVEMSDGQARVASDWAGPLAVAGGSVYVAVRFDALHALDARNGRERWRFAPERGVLDQSWVADGTVYVAAMVGIGESDEAPRQRLHALDAATGAKHWTRDDEPGGHVETYAAVGNGTFYLAGIGDDDSNLVAIDTATGRERWTHGADGRIEVAPVLVGDALYVTSGDNGLFGSGQTWLGAGTNIHVLDAASGDRRWRIDLGVGLGREPTVADGKVFVAFLPGYGAEPGTLSAYGDA